MFARAAPRRRARRLAGPRPRRAGLPEARARPSSTGCRGARARSRPPHHGAPGQGRVLGHRDQARAGAGSRRLSGVHAQGAHRRLVPRLRARDARGAATRSIRMFATHNAHTIAWVEALRERDCATSFEFQRLHGMGEALYDAGDRAAAAIARAASTRRSAATRTCCPTSCGGCSRTAPTPRSSTASPIRRCRSTTSSPIRSRRRARCGLRARIRASRCPSTCSAASGAIRPAYRSPTRTRWPRSTPRSPQRRRARRSRRRCSRAARATGTARDAFDPADRTRRIGTVDRRRHRDASTARSATSSSGQVAWDARRRRRARRRPRARGRRASKRERDALRRAARARSRQDAAATRSPKCARRPISAATTRSEALRHFDGPVALPSPTGESNTLSLHGRGVFACISPWNFPLAIFAGQVAAALAAGNAVAAKPAEQTPLTAALAVRCLLEAGVPADALRCLPGAGETVGAALVGDRADRRRRVHRLDRRRAAHRTRARRARADRAADRRDRRPERDDRRQLGAARAGGDRRRVLGVQQRRASAARRCACCACRRRSRRA